MTPPPASSSSPPPLPLEFTVPGGTFSVRLDAALGLVLPEMGLRGRRRLWDWCRVLVNGKPRPPGYAVAAGDRVRLETRAPGHASGARPQKPLPVELVALGEGFAAFAKPAGLHTARVAGSPEPSLEQWLAKNWPGILAGLAAEGAEPAPAPDAFAAPRLLTRLDRETSGLALAALTPEAERRFRELERLGQVEKTYHAVVRGGLRGERTLRNRLLTGNRSVTGVLEEADPDAARHTLVRALEEYRVPGAEPGTLVQAVIRRGARHQIRAHLAHAGYPIVGDGVYGSGTGEGGLFLHHWRTALPGFCATLAAPWLSMP